MAMSCPDPVQLRKLVDGSAAPDEQAALALHLDGCAQCQAALDQMTGGRDSWGDVAKQLAEPPAPDEPALALAIKELHAETGRMETAAEPKPVTDTKLDFLDPPETPGHLGRLGHYEILEVVGQG